MYETLPIQERSL